LWELFGGKKRKEYVQKDAHFSVFFGQKSGGYKKGRILRVKRILLSFQLPEMLRKNTCYNVTR
jgi:hypothetical protein